MKNIQSIKKTKLKLIIKDLSRFVKIIKLRNYNLSEVDFYRIVHYWCELNSHNISRYDDYPIFEQIELMWKDLIKDLERQNELS